MTLKFNIGDYILDLTMKEEGNNVVRVGSLYIDKISSIHDGMMLSEWITVEHMNKLIREHVLECNPETTLIYSKQPRKRLRRFNIK